jgi:uncharacterized protein YdaU (DUF1376 family)
MIKDNKYLFYYQENINEVLDLQDDFSIEEIGLFVILKATYFKTKGVLAEDKLCQLCKFFGNKNDLLKVAKKIFVQQDGLLVNQQWNSQIEGIKEKSTKRKEAADARWQKEHKLKADKLKKTQDNPQEPTGLLVESESQFENFWQSYKPIHTGKGNKEKSKLLFLKALKKDSLEAINKGLADYMQHCWNKNTYTKSVEVWLRNEGWKDEYSTQELSVASPLSQFNHLLKTKNDRTT